MPLDNNEIFIEDIVKLSKETTNGLEELISHFIKIFHELQAENANLIKQKNFFLQERDKRHFDAYQDEEQKTKALEQKSRMAAMGEMIDSVAHQWKQPLNAIAMVNDMLKTDFEDALVDKEYIEDFTQTVDLQVTHMIDTLNEFRTFFRPSKKSEHFKLIDCINSVKILLQDQLISNNVRFNTKIDEYIYIFGMSNELKHVFINLINNSIDAFNENEVQERAIELNASQENKIITITVEDSGGGIPQSVISDVFKQNVTTKAEGKGTGIGLYMSHQIVQKHSGTISVNNSAAGALFTIILRQSTT